MSDLSHTDDRLTNETVDLLQQLIRHECVNTGEAESGEEVRNSDLLEGFLEGEAFEEMIESLTLQAQEESLNSL